MEVLETRCRLDDKDEWVRPHAAEIQNSSAEAARGDAQA